MLPRNPASPDVLKSQEKSAPTRAHSAAFVAAARRHAARSDDAHAFIADPSEHTPGRRDDFANELAEEFLTAATSGEPVSQEARDTIVPEDSGGPFVVTSARTEFAKGTDASNPADAEVEAFPTATAAPRRTRA